jgi:hypothetical protein
VNEETKYEFNEVTPAWRELDEERLGRIAGEILDARLEDEDVHRREEEGMTA